MNQAGGSSSSSCFRWSFDVFLSFRGEDTRSNFTSHLNMTLRQRGINVFIDKKLSRGEEICASLLEAIEGSKISIVVISESYASSSWCLNELVKIIMCNKLRGQVVLPIFYKVDPSEVGKQSGRFGEEFAKLEVRFFNKMQAWKEALITVSHMSGWPVLQRDDEANLIQNIVQEVWKKLDRATMQLDVAKYPVGIDIQVRNLLPHVMSNGITMFGLYGVGGMGKTTIAKALYNKIADEFEGCCFLSNIREASNQYGGLVQFQKELLCEILMDDSIKVSNLPRGITIIRNRLYSKKILLILDDVDTREQLQALAGGHDWFGHGSKVIATTRNKQLLVTHGFDKMQNVGGLDYDEALELFSWHCFRNSHPLNVYLELSKRAVDYCKGLPLALEVLGSFLHSIGDPSNFKRILDEYEKHYLDKDIQDSLRISYDGLEDEGITKLMNLSLLTIGRFNRVEMHNIIQQMGRTIHLSETSKSHKRKRLLIKDDAMDVLNGNKEARAVKVIKLNFPKPTKLDIDSRAFDKVKNLVVLEVGNATSSESSTLEYLPSSLRWMNWPQFPFSSLPTTYTMENLIELKLPYSSIKHFGQGYMSCERLKEINLSDSNLLVEIPDLSTAINLKYLNLVGCENLVKVHESIGSLSKLVALHFSSSVKGFEQFPSCLKLKSLKFLSMKNCRIDEWCPQFSEEMKSIEYLSIGYSTVTYQLSPTIGYLTSLKHLSLYYCKELTTLPKISKVPEGVICMSAAGSISLARFPNNLADFMSCDDSVEYCKGGELKQLVLMNCHIPDWYRYKSMSDSLTFFLPADYLSWKWKPLFAPCVKFEVTNDDWFQKLECKVFINDIQVWSSEEVYANQKERSGMFGKVSPGEYMWLIVLDPHTRFQSYSDDIMDRRSLKIIDLNQLSSEINSSQSILGKITVSFEVTPWYKDVVIKMCGVHVIMGE
uniref:Putative TIR-NBS-LRR-AAA+ATPase n=1 Tax=Cucumis sativus TaxID=3659 RepID=D9I8I5_CUCSA|nr:TIR-NBS-LRR class resistance protein [Cucumis sativus]ADU33174.1 putative TIR-NBS-LRR-AAA+ATPase [Cucumis sativus]